MLGRYGEIVMGHAKGSCKGGLPCLNTCDTLMSEDAALKSLPAASALVRAVASLAVNENAYLNPQREREGTYET